MTPFDFDTIPERRSTHAVKWTLFDGDDLLPMWVADMDFRSPPAVIEALHARAEHGIFGYTFDNPELRTVIVERLAQRYDWQVQPEHIVFMPGLVTSFGFVGRIFAEKGDGILIQPPIYPPFLAAPKGNDQRTVLAELRMVREGQRLHYEVDDDALEAGARDAKVFLLCNPHNPVGRVYTRAELLRMAEIMLANDVLILSDEIHADLLFDDHQHIPIAALSPEIADRTITLMAPSKTFNIAGLSCAFAVIPNDALRKTFAERAFGSLGFVNIFGYEAALAAYKHGGPWLDAALSYMQANRDYLVDFVERELPGVAITKPEGTYLAWLDFNALDLPADSAFAFLKDRARVVCNDGAAFGTCGTNFVRLNFGTPRALLTEALERIRDAVQGA